AEPQPRLVDQLPLDALHGPGDRAAGRDRVQTELVAACTGRDHRIRIAHPAQWSEREHVLVLHPGLLASLSFVDVLAADRARRARVARDLPELRDLLGTQR